MTTEMFSTRLNDLMSIESIGCRELARKIAVNHSCVICWLSGRFYPRYDVLIKLADCFNVSINYLLGIDTGLGEKAFKQNSISNVPERFCEKLQKYMEIERITKYRLSKKIKIGQTTLTKWFNCGSMPETAILIRIANLMGQTVDFLLSRE